MKDRVVVSETSTSPQAEEPDVVSNGDEDLDPQTGHKLETLREVILGHDRQQMAEMKAELGQLEQRVTDPDKLITVVTPVMSQVVRRTIRDGREEMIEALYPIIGSLVMRAVSEAIRDLARTIDAQARTSFNLSVLWRRVQARLGGVRGAELALRDALPFHVSELFLIHKEKGILLLHLSGSPDSSPDSDLISSMLTAIRDFVQDSFGQDKQGQLDEIQYGEQSILLETANHVYLAALVEGIAPSGFRAALRERVIEISHAHEDTLRDYDGDVTALISTEPSLRSLIEGYQANHQLNPVQKRIIYGLVALLLICVLASCWAGGWAWQQLSNSPPSPVSSLVVAPTHTPTMSPTPSPTHTSSPTRTPSPTATPTATATTTNTPSPTATDTALPTVTSTAMPTATIPPTTAPVSGAMIGSAWVRLAPTEDAGRLSVALEPGLSVQVLAAFQDWYQVRWSPQTGVEVVGWVPAQWIETATSIPAELVTPTPN